jgi:ABC-type nitrate/sulfonate/bicarbonate transport system substrate-binding protein
MKAFVRVCVLLTLVALVGACTPAAQTSPSPTAPATSQPTGGASPSGDITLPPPEQSEVSIGVAAFVIGHVAPYIAQDEGIFEKRGLTVELPPFEGDGPAGQAIAAGQIDGAFMGGGPVLSTTAAGEPMKIVYVLLAVPTDSLVTPTSITDGEGLRGKQVAISTFGGDSHTAVVTALEALGLEQDDVTIVQVGGQSDRYAAVQSGAVQAAPVEGITDEELSGLGLHRLIDLRESGLRLVRAGLALPDEFIEQNPNTVLNLVAALMEGQALMLEDEELAIATFMEHGGVDREEAEANVDPIVLEQMDPTGRATTEMIDLQKEALEVANPAIADVPSEDAFTNEFIDQLDQLGFLDQLGIGD